MPCKATCPAVIDVPRYVQLVGLGMYGEAVAVVREKLPFPGILGVLFFFKNGNVEPHDAFPLHASIELLVMVIIKTIIN